VRVTGADGNPRISGAAGRPLTGVDDKRGCAHAPEAHKYDYFSVNVVLCVLDSFMVYERFFVLPA
jgi:hypothetical protein